MDWSRFRLAAIARIAVVSLLLVVLICQFVWFAMNPPETPRSFSGTKLDGEYDEYVGQRGEIKGTVVATDPVVVAIDRDDTDVRIKLNGLGRQADIGDRMSVYGVLQQDREMRVIGTVVVPWWGTLYTYVVSFAAGVCALVLFVRHWRFDPGSLALEPRNRSLAHDFKDRRDDDA